MKISKIESGKNTNIGILYYLKNHISISTEIDNISLGIHTDIQVNEYFQNSPDYQKLTARINQQKKKILSVRDLNLLTFEQKKLKELEENEKLFRTNTLRLAEIFLNIKHKTERLDRAMKLFEDGNILAADKVLIELDLIEDQDMLLAKMAYLKKRKIYIEALLHIE